MGSYTYPSPISWLNGEEETGAHLVEELGRLSALVLAQNPRKEGIYLSLTEPPCILVPALRGTASGPFRP